MIYSTFSEGLTISLFSVLIVFLILSVVAISISSLKYLVIEKKAEAPKVLKSVKKYISLDEISDEDMMVAALIASIDYYDEIKKDVRVVSIKEINN